MQPVPGFTPPPPYLPIEFQLIKSLTWFYAGLMISVMLYGVTLMQGWTYLTSGHKDSWKMVAMVLFVLCLDSSTSILSMVAGQHYFIDNYGNVGTIAIMPLSFDLENTLTVVTTFVVQLFFARQIYVFNKKSWPVVIVVLVFSLAALGLGIAVTVETIKVTNHNSLASLTNTIMIATGQGMDVASDIVATIAMTYMLNGTQTSPFQQTGSLVKSLVLFMVNRAIVVTIVQLLYLITFVTAPSSTHWVVFHMIVSKVYVNTFLLMLNARNTLRQKHRNEFSKQSARVSTTPSYHLKPAMSALESIDSIGDRRTPANLKANTETQLSS